MVNKNRPYLPNILSLSGTEKNVGKTTLACHIIKRMGNVGKVIAAKFSPHFHTVDYKSSLSEKPGAYALYREDRSDRSKDSSKMLAAGAERVYYIQTRDDHLEEVWDRLAGFLGDTDPVIIESGGIHEIIKPGLSLLLTRSGKRESEKIDTENYTEVIHGMEELESISDLIGYKDGRWNLQGKYD